MAHLKPILQLRGVICFSVVALPIFASAADTSRAVPNNPATAQELPQITVIGNTPLAGLGLPLNQIPSNVQTADSEGESSSCQTIDLAMIFTLALARVLAVLWCYGDPRCSLIDAPKVHVMQGGKPESQGINNTASRLRRRGELLGAWNGREFLHPTFQFQADTGRLMPEMKTLLDMLPKDRSGWRQVLWLFQRHGQLDGKRPADVFQKNPDSVVAAARSDFELNDEQW